MARFIRTERDGRLFIITLNRPEVLNALNAPAAFELSEAFDEFVADDELWVGIVTGQGRAFCAGHDLVDAPDEDMPATGWAGLSERQDIDKPLIAAVNGAAMGGGFEIALACDIVIADEDAYFGLPEPRWNAVALGGGAQRLVARMPRAVAMGLMLTGKRMSAAEAERWGVVNEVAPRGTSLQVARRWADDVLKCAPLAVRHTKRIAREAWEGKVFTDQLAQRRQDVAKAIFESEDIHEGLAAFREKRAPVWRGR